MTNEDKHRFLKVLLNLLKLSKVEFRLTDKDIVVKACCEKDLLKVLGNFSMGIPIDKVDSETLHMRRVKSGELLEVTKDGDEIHVNVTKNGKPLLKDYED